jgi:hypothetical protein
MKDIIAKILLMRAGILALALYQLKLKKDQLQNMNTPTGLFIQLSLIPIK